MADGYSSEVERTVALNLIEKLNLSGYDEKAALIAFEKGKHKNFKFGKALEEFKRNFRFNKRIREQFVRLQLQALLSTDDVSPEIFNIIYAIAAEVNVSARKVKQFYAKIDVEHIRKFYRNEFRSQQTYADQKFKQRSNEQRRQQQQKSSNNKFEKDKSGRWYDANSELTLAYKILGVSVADDDAQIKRAYRVLMSRNHPDKVLTRDSTEEEKQQANDQVITIRNAYELIKAKRNIR